MKSEFCDPAKQEPNDTISGAKKGSITSSLSFTGKLLIGLLLTGCLPFGVFIVTVFSGFYRMEMNHAPFLRLDNPDSWQRLFENRVESAPPVYNWGEYVWKNLGLALLIFLITLLITGGICWLLLTRDMSRQAQELSEVAKTIGRGQYDVASAKTSSGALNALMEGLHNLSAQLRKATERQRMFERERREMLMALSHDLKTPLTSIRGYLEALIDQVPQSPVDREIYLQTALAKTEQLEQRIQDLLSFARVEATADQSVRERVLLGEWLEEVSERLRRDIEAQGIELEVELNPDPVWVDFDTVQMERAVTNLLWNARRHTPAGGIITVGVTRVNDDQAILWVRDTGEGIPSVDLPHIFDLFFRGEKSRNEDKGGSGVGLAIVKRTVELHGGQVEVESRIGVGTEFHLLMPTVYVPVVPYKRLLQRIARYQAHQTLSSLNGELDPTDRTL